MQKPAKHKNTILLFFYVISVLCLFFVSSENIEFVQEFLRNQITNSRKQEKKVSYTI